MKPYYDRGGIRIFHGDSLEVLPKVLGEDRFVVVTDPIWPNGSRAFPGVNPWHLFHDVVDALCEIETGEEASLARLVVILGCDSDPRFLEAVPHELPFVRVCKLRYPAPSYKHPILIDFDVAYVFGERFENGNGTHRLLPGECRGRQAIGRAKWQRPGGGKNATRMSEAPTHPCPRNPDHVLWLVENFTRPSDLVVDPFNGSGTTTWACRELGRRAIGIEIDERWCAQAVDRLRQDVLFPPQEITDREECPLSEKGDSP